MLTISESAFAALSRRSEQAFAVTLSRWVAQQPELRTHAGQASPLWCDQTVALAQRFGVDSEDDVSRFARLRLLRGDGWLQSPPAQEVLTSERDGQLKLFQLECLHWGIAHGD